MADEYIKRKNVLECIKESRDGIDWGQSEDGDAFLHYSACLYRTIASNECFPSADVVEVVRCKDCIYWQKPQVKLKDGKYRDYTEEETKAGEIVDSSVGINVGSFCAKYNRYHINRIPQFMGENDFCSRGERRMDGGT